MTTSHRILPLAAAILLAVPSLSYSLTINLTYDTNGQAGSVPAGDPSGTQLMALCQAAADYWENIIEDAHTLNLQVRYDNGITGIGKWTETAESGGRATDGIIHFKGTTTWYYDPTPTNNSEYAMAQTLVRDLSLATFNNIYAGAPPQVLETYFFGDVVPGAPAAAMNATDLYSVILHEICHGLGMSSQLSTCATEIADGDYDVFPSLANGAIFDVIVNTSGGAHTICNECLMNSAIPQQRRRLPSATDVLALATCPSPGWTAIDLPRQDFLPGGTFDWNTASNWVGNQIPGSADDAFCRMGGGDVLLSNNVFASNVFVSSQTDIQTNAFKLNVVQTATIEYDGVGVQPQIFVEAGGELEASVIVVNGGELDMTGGLADANTITTSADTSGLQGEVVGYGTVDVATTFSNSGRVYAENGDAFELTFTSSAASPWDLDGDGDGQVFATQGNVNFASGAMSDAFDGLIQVSDPYTLTIAEPWSLGAGGVVDLNGGSPGLATLAGGTITAGNGDFQCSMACLISSPVNFSGFVDLTIFSSGVLTMNGFTTYNGGDFTLGLNSIMELNGGSVFQNGTFNLISDSTLQVDGTTNLNGGTFNIGTGAIMTLNGTHTLQAGTYDGSGSLRFVGPTIISQPVTIDCATLDFDGSGILSKQVTLNNDLTVNSTSLDTSGAVNTFDSTLNINNNFTSLTIAGPPSWTMNGTMNINSGTTLTFPSINGVPFTMSGTTNLLNSTAWNARTLITGTVTTLAASNILSLAGGDIGDPNRIQGGSINGPGRLRIFQTALTGYGSIGASCFADSSPTRILADDGILSLSGGITDTPDLIGTADADGTLNVTGSWTLAGGSILDLEGGSVTGDSVINENVTRGFGSISTVQIVNNGEISATDNERLTINTTNAPDLDGTGSAAIVLTHTLNAVEGNITVVDLVTDLFGGTANIGPGRDMTFTGGWTLAGEGVLNMTGNGTGSRAYLYGGGSTLSGTLNIDDEVWIGSPSSFTSSSITNFADSSSALRFGANSTIAAGATFTGPGGILANVTPSVMTLQNGVSIGATLNNAGKLILGSSPGAATVSSFGQSVFGSLEIELLGTPDTTNWDRLIVSGNAQLAGTLNVTFNVPGAQAGDTWKVVEAGSVSGSFSALNVAGVPAGFSLLKFESGDGVYLKLASSGSYLDWATAAGIPLSDIDTIDDPDGDLIQNGIEAFLGGDPLAADPGLLPVANLIDSGGSDYLSITVPVATDNLINDLTLSVTRSTDLENWSTNDVILIDSVFDVDECIEWRTYRSGFPVGTFPAELLRIEVNP